MMSEMGNSDFKKKIKNKKTGLKHWNTEGNAVFHTYWLNTGRNQEILAENTGKTH